MTRLKSVRLHLQANVQLDKRGDRKCPQPNASGGYMIAADNPNVARSHVAQLVDRKRTFGLSDGWSANLRYRQGSGARRP